MMHPEAYRDMKENELPEEQGFDDIEYQGENEEVLRELEREGFFNNLPDLK